MKDSHEIIGSVCACDGTGGIAVTVSPEGEVVLGVYGPGGFFIQDLRAEMAFTREAARCLGQLLQQPCEEESHG